MLILKKNDFIGYIIGMVVCCFIGLIIWGMFSIFSNPEEDAISNVRKKGDISKCRAYIQGYPNGVYTQEVRDTIFKHIDRLDFSPYWMLKGCPFFNEIKDSIIYRLDELNQPIYWKKYLNLVEPEDSILAIKKFSESVEKAYLNACQINTLEGWLYFIDIVPPEEIRDAEERIHSLLSISNPNRVALLVITFPYSKDPYKVEVKMCNSDFYRNKTFIQSKYNSTDSLYLPYGKYIVDISAPNTMRYSEIMTIENSREWILLSSRKVTIKR